MTGFGHGQKTADALSTRTEFGDFKINHTSIGDKNHVTGKSQLLIEAYAISGIKRNELNDAQRRFIDKIIMLLIEKCNREDKPVAGIADALRQIPDAVREDPLFS